MPTVPTPRRIAFLGGYPPRLCGIATFTHDLYEAVSAVAPDSQCLVCAVNDKPEGYAYLSVVQAELDEKDLDSYRKAADFLNLNNIDILCVQHEFGIYGGDSGIYLLALLKEVRMPIVTTLHTILSEPTASQRTVMDALIKRSDRVVVMAQKGIDILQETYQVSPTKIDLIPHGIPDSPFVDSSVYKKAFGVEGRQVLLTFGLIGPGKGIEYVIQALPAIVKENPQVVYLILGVTHPHLIAREGEAYRLGLERMAEDLGMKDHVIFYNRFVSLNDLQEFIGATDIYITPYLNEEQITSGTLAYVFGAGKAVVSTPYWHAKELLRDGRGALVPFRNSKAISEAVCEYLSNPTLLKSTQQQAYLLGRKTIWKAVAQQYIDSFQHARADQKALPRTTFGEWTLATRPYDLPPLRLDHIMIMTDPTGIFQHALYHVPNFHEGYCTDDNARAFILTVMLEDRHRSHSKINRLSIIYLAFLTAAFNPQKGRFRNFMSHGREWLEEVGSEDSHARAVWALGTGAGKSSHPGNQKLSKTLFKQAISIVQTFTSPRAWAFALLGIHEYHQRFESDEEVIQIRTFLTHKLITLWKDYADESWPWFEDSVTYENGRLCQALILSGHDDANQEAIEVGLKSLRWLSEIQKSPTGHFFPIGSYGFYKRNGIRENFDQQPVEAQAMIAACLAAHRITQDANWAQEAKHIFEWFLGRNDLGVPLYDATTGGCNDGLQSERLNENQGAESTLAFHLSLAEMNNIEPLKIYP